MRLADDNLEDKVLTFEVGSGTYGIPLGWVCGIETIGEIDPGVRLALGLDWLDEDAIFEGFYGHWSCVSVFVFHAGRSRVVVRDFEGRASR